MMLRECLLRHRMILTRYGAMQCSDQEGWFDGTGKR
jgi:hypothetical protein